MWCYKVYFFLPGHVIVTVLSSQTSCVMCFWVCTNLLFCEKVKIFSTKEREKENCRKQRTSQFSNDFEVISVKLHFYESYLRKKNYFYMIYPHFFITYSHIYFIFLISNFIHNNSSTRCKSCASRSTRKNFIIKQQFHIVMTCRSP